jgi:hypothetical protein
MGTLIKPEYLEKLEAACLRRGWQLVAYQNIPKVDAMTAPFAIILTYRPEDMFKYIVYAYNFEDGGFHQGDYHTFVSEAWHAFGERVLRNWPKWADDPVPEDAPENYFRLKMGIDK